MGAIHVLMNLDLLVFPAIQLTINERESMKEPWKALIRNFCTKVYLLGNHALVWWVLSRMDFITALLGSLAIVIADLELAFVILAIRVLIALTAKIHISR
jgi:hypothetical protein